MKMTIDNRQGLGPVDYTTALDGTVAPQVVRKINQPATLRCGFVGSAAGFVAPAIGARIGLARADGSFVFTGYLTEAAQAEYVGCGEQGAVYRYGVIAESDEVLLDQKALPNRAPLANRTAGTALRALVQDLLPGTFDTSGIEDVDTLSSYTVNPQKTFSYHAGEIALAARASYRTMNGALLLAPVGAATFAIDENDVNFSPAGLKISSPNLLANDVMVIGLDEPQAYVRDYFVGDGLSLRFYLSQKPFPQSKLPLIDEEYAGPGLDPTTWVVNDPMSAIAVAAQTLQVTGGTGQDGQTSASFVEQIELGGALELQHGDITFNGPSQGVIGGLYAGAISAAGCLAGFQVTPNGMGSKIQALINGAPTGLVVATTEGHRYVLTTFVYAMEVYRAGETYHSSLRGAGDGWGGAAVPADVRFVLELQDINPVSQPSLVAPATVLYDGVVENAPGFCTYGLVNAANMQCGIAYTYVTHISLALVRSALPNAGYVTVPVGSLSDGAQCAIVSSTSLDFYPQYVPPLNTLIVASYRGYGRAVAEVMNAGSVASLVSGVDNGVRGRVRTMKAPSARTQADCECAALAILDDAAGAAWTGSYETWSEFLPGEASDIFPGDALAVKAPSRGADFDAIVRQVKIDLLDPANDRGMYTIEFANELAKPLAYQDAATAVTIPLQDMPPRLATTQVGAYYLTNLTNAQITNVSSTTVTVDAGVDPPSGCGIEVRVHDYGWGVANDRNLLGRFSKRTFTLPRLARAQNYFLRLYNNSSPVCYSRYAAALHIDYPL